MTRQLLIFASLLCAGSVSGQSNSAPAKPIRVAIYADAGAAKTRGTVADAVEKVAGFKADLLTADDIRTGKLKDYTVLIQPGGSGSGQAKALGEEGRNKIKEFVKSGGGYMGICAGSYLASRSYDWSLSILDAEVLDRAHWARGTGMVELKYSSTGKSFFTPAQNNVSVYYGQGPLLAPGKDAAIPDYEELAAYETEIHSRNGAKPGVMKGTTAAARGSFGSGRVFCFSPHPEKTESPEAQAMFRKALLWTANQP